MMPRSSTVTMRVLWDFVENPYHVYRSGEEVKVDRRTARRWEKSGYAERLKEAKK